MNTAEQKAKELIEKYRKIIVEQVWSADMVLPTQCALICVEEILATCPQKENEIFAISKGMEFWNEVKQYLLTQK